MSNITQQIRGIKAAKDYDFGPDADPAAVQAIQDYWNTDCLTDEQQDLILDEYDSFVDSKSPEAEFLTLATRAVDFADDDYPYEQMVGLFKLPGHVGEWAEKDIDAFVNAIVLYPNDFDEGAPEILRQIEEDGNTDRYDDEIRLLKKYSEMSVTVDRAKLAYGAALDWINTLIQKGELETDVD